MSASVWRWVAASAVLAAGALQAAHWVSEAIALQWYEEWLGWMWLSGPALALACCGGAGIALARSPKGTALAAGIMTGTLAIFRVRVAPFHIGRAEVAASSTLTAFALVALLAAGIQGRVAWAEGWRLVVTDAICGFALAWSAFFSVGWPGWRGGASAWAVVAAVLLLLSVVHRAKTISLVMLVGAAGALAVGAVDPPTWWNGGCVTWVHPISAGWVLAAPLVGTLLLWTGPMIRYLRHEPGTGI